MEKSAFGPLAARTYVNLCSVDSGISSIHSRITRAVRVCHRYRCRQIPAFCDDTDWPVLEWEMLLNQNGEPLSGEAQETSWFYTPEDREGGETPVNDP